MKNKKPIKQKRNIYIYRRPLKLRNTNRKKSDN